MALGIYIHIPYCIQKCTYCDFATYERSQIMPMPEYVNLLLEEIRQKAHLFKSQNLTSIYFGGGTPSLLPEELIVAILEELANHGLKTSPQTEMTLEVNPGTIDAAKLKRLLSLGFNRFSIGAQTFSDSLLKSVNREHNAQTTHESLELLKQFGASFSVDLLFALPGQNLAQLKIDLQTVLKYSPQHISTYCLTVTPQHKLYSKLLTDETQVSMFEYLSSELLRAGYERYELSSYAKPGFQSQHNYLYWTFGEYWGIGMSSHSYVNHGPWGTRFWNPSQINSYKKHVLAHQGRKLQSFCDGLGLNQFESLKEHETLTDYCHVSLRQIKGLNLSHLESRFSPFAIQKAKTQLAILEAKNWLKKTSNGFCLSEKGLLLSNLVFQELTFLDKDLTP